MSLLLTLLGVLIGPYLVFAVAGRWLRVLRLSPRDRSKVGITILFLITGSAHFFVTAQMASMIPPFVPARVAIVYMTGVFELLGAVGIWIPRLARLTGLCLILLLIAVFPANVYAAWHYLPIVGHEAGPRYLLMRTPFQLILIVWIYLATGQAWLRSRIYTSG